MTILYKRSTKQSHGLQCLVVLVTGTMLMVLMEGVVLSGCQAFSSHAGMMISRQQQRQRQEYPVQWSSSPQSHSRSSTIGSLDTSGSTTSLPTTVSSVSNHPSNKSSPPPMSVWWKRLGQTIVRRIKQSSPPPTLHHTPSVPSRHHHHRPTTTTHTRWLPRRFVTILATVMIGILTRPLKAMASGGGFGGSTAKAVPLERYVLEKRYW